MGVYHVLLVFLCVASFIVVGCWLISLFDDTSSLRHPRTYSKHVHLTFVQFAKLYVGAPDAWKVDKDTATYCGAEHYDVVFSLHSAWQYRRWWRYKDRQAARLKALKDQASFIADIRNRLVEAEAKTRVDICRQLHNVQPDLFERRIPHDH